MIKKSNLLLLTLVILSLATSYYHSFGVNSISYGSGDAFGLILSSTNIEKKPATYLISYVYRIFYEITSLSVYNLTFYFTPILFIVLLIFIFKVLEKNTNLTIAFFSCFLITTNPWLSFYSTEPSKAFFVLLFFFASLFFLYRYKKNNAKKEILLSFLFLSFSSVFYHTALMFFPSYFLLLYFNIYKKINLINIKSFINLFLIFLILFVIISYPFYYTKFQEPKKGVKDDPKITESGKMSFFKFYINAVRAAINAPENLGYKTFLGGIKKFLVFDLTWLFFIFSLMILIAANFSGFYKKNLLIDFVLIFLFTFAFISIQWKSYSHGSRYPQYTILFLFIILSYFLDLVLSKFFNKTKKALYIKALYILTLIILILSPEYIFSYVEGLRHIYIPQLEVKDLILKNNININQENQVLYLGWPAITLALKDLGIMESYYHPFGWEHTNLTLISSEDYVLKNNINYYIYDHTGDDYYNSSDIVLDELRGNFNLVLIDKTKGENLYIIIYKIIENERTYD